MLIMPGHYGHDQSNKKKKPGVRLDMKKMPANVRKKLLEQLKKKKKRKDTRYNPYGQGSTMNPTKASETTGP